MLFISQFKYFAYICSDKIGRKRKPGFIGARQEPVVRQEQEV